MSRRPFIRMEFFLVAVGTHGDVLPFIALGHELARRGHGVAVAAPAPFEGMVRRAGLPFQPLGTVADYERVIRAPDLWHPRRGVRPLFEYATALAEITVLWLGASWARERNGVVVASPLALGARVAQDLYDLPLATMQVMPFLIESAHAPPRLPGLPLPSFLSARFRSWMNLGADRYVIGPAALPPLNALRAKLGLGPVHRLRFWWNSPTRMLLMFPGWFTPPQPDWPEQAIQIGFPLVDRFGDVAEMPPELSAFLDAGDAPLAFTYGSAMRQGGRFFETAIRRCERMGRRGVLLAPQNGQVRRDLPPGIIHLSYAPFGQLLPRCAALIHHGGIGTVAQAFAAGIPQLVVPVAFDHFDEGRRLTELGLGASLSRRAFRPARAARELDRLLNDPAVLKACAEAKARVLAEDAIAVACDRAEDMLRHPGLSATQRPGETVSRAAE